MGRVTAVAVAVAVAALAVAAPAGAGASSSGTPALRPVVLPRDQGSHPGFGIEWWYTAGRLTDARGGRYFYFATVWSAAPGLVARINVVGLAPRPHRCRPRVHQRYPADPAHDDDPCRWLRSLVASAGAWGVWSMDRIRHGRSAIVARAGSDTTGRAHAPAGSQAALRPARERAESSGRVRPRRRTTRRRAWR